MKFKLIASIILVVIMLVAYLIISANSGNQQPQPSQDQGIRIN